MKKTVKIVALISIVCIMMSTLSGCSFINDLREGKVVVDEKGDLFYKNNVYIKLDKDCEELYFDYDFNTEQEMYISKEEEPVLYGFFKSDFCSLSRDKLLIEDFEGNIYCREDKYDSVVEKIENGFTPEKYMYTYEVYKEGSFLDYEWEEKIRYLTDSDFEKIDEVFEKVHPITNGSNMISNSYYCVEMYGCTEDLLFRKYAFDIFYLDDKYYLQTEDEYYNPLVYEVPAKYNKDFKKMIKEYVDSFDEMYY